MTVKISRLPFKTLWNSEYTLFVNQTVGITEKYHPENLHLARSFGRLKDLQTDLSKIKAHESGSVISNRLHELDTERDTLIIALAAQVKTLGKLSMPSVAPHVLVLDHFFDIHGRDIALDNYNAETKRISDLLEDYDAKPDVKTAAEALNLKILFDQLRVVNTQFGSLFLQRTGEDAATDRADARAIRNEADKALTALFDAFEFCSSEYDNLDYDTPANELNDLIAYYRTQLKARATRRNAGKDVSEEKAIV